ncbi:hypothetical protein ABT144_14540 [Streptomyces sp. NPDC002039]|uniref:hypothetical protein n=1 Tax=Streptomyces sp. NPDC002039 TaxID=3154660 RepID=UPI0033270098
MPQDGNVMLAVVAVWSAWSREASLLGNGRLDPSWLRTARRDWDTMLAAAKNERSSWQAAKHEESQPHAVRLELLAVDDTPLQSVNSSAASQKAWLQTEQRRCEESLQPPPASPRSAGADQRLQAFDVANYPIPPRSLGEIIESVQRAIDDTEPRSEEEYRQQVQRYIAQCSERLPVAIQRAALARLAPLKVRLVNRTDLNLRDVELCLYIPGEVEAHHPSAYADNESVTGLPGRPTPFGSGRRKSTLHHALAAGIATLPPPREHPIAMSMHVADPARPDIANGGSVTITFRLGHLRPRGAADARGIIVLAHTPAGSLIAATCTNHDTVVTGTLDLPVADEALSPDVLFLPTDNTPHE